MGTHFGFLRVNGAVEVDLATGRRREGVVIGTDRIGLALMRVRTYTATGWRIEDPAQAEFLPWSNIHRVGVLTKADLEEAERRGIFAGAGYRPHDGTATSSRVPFLEALR